MKNKETLFSALPRKHLHSNVCLNCVKNYKAYRHYSIHKAFTEKVKLYDRIQKKMWIHWVRIVFAWMGIFNRKNRIICGFLCFSLSNLGFNVLHVLWKNLDIFLHIICSKIIYCASAVFEKNTLWDWYFYEM